jgi:oxygen-independent coproporphyrinogen-3 oxidase
MTLSQVELKADQLTDAKEFLKEMLEDGLVEIQGQILKLTDLGRPFLRNACLFFDRRYRTQKPQAKTFSQAI